MSKGDDTRNRVLSLTGGLMNRTGYLATPLSSILDTVGLQKGGLYNHFESKEALALEAYQTNARAIGTYLLPLVRGSDPAQALWAVIEASVDIAAGKVVPGGCPVLNAGTEADDANGPLLAAAAQSYENLRRFLLLPLGRLQRAGRLKAGTDIEALAWLLLAAVEGGILSTRVTGNSEGQNSALKALRGLMMGVLE